jgi:hypothetical protein
MNRQLVIANIHYTSDPMPSYSTMLFSVDETRTDVPQQITNYLKTHEGLNGVVIDRLQLVSPIEL